MSWSQGRSIPKTEAARQQEEVEPGPLPEGQKYRYDLWQGLTVSVDIFEPLLQLATLDYANYEADVMANFHHRFFPMASVGMGQCDTHSDIGSGYGTDDKKEHTYRSHLAPFFKLGCGYNLRYNATKPEDFYLIFVRYGCSWNTADIEGLNYYDGLWKPYGPADLNNLKISTHWLEVGIRLNVEVTPRIVMGWDAYAKFQLHQSGTESGDPYWVPGFGVNDNHVGFLFHVGYRL